MKNTATPQSEQELSDDMRAEYSFDYSKARPNRFAGKIDKSQVVVMLAPDIAVPVQRLRTCLWSHQAYQSPGLGAVVPDLHESSRNQVVVSRVVVG